jgi:ribose/xylose/arabinose/galactoside ABC-type transport system permease subunit
MSAFATTTRPRGPHAWLSLARRYDAFLLLAAFALCATLTTSEFATEQNVDDVLRQAAVLGVLALAEFLVILVGGFDLSVGAVLALSSVVAVRLWDVSPALACACAVLAGVVIGLLNGLLVTLARIPSLIATLGTMGVARGAAFAVSGSAIAITDENFVSFMRSTVVVIPVIAALWVAIAAVVHYVLRVTKTGCHVYAVGGDDRAARLAGVDVDRIRLLTYTAAGGLAGAAGVLFVARFSSGMPTAAQGWELDAIAAVVIGGARLFGGQGTVPKAMAGVLVYVLIADVMNLAGIEPFLQFIVKAAIVLLAVGMRASGDRSVSA